MKLEFKYKHTGELPMSTFLEFRDITSDESVPDFKKELAALAIMCDVPEDDIYKLTPQEAQYYIAQMHQNISKFNLSNSDNNLSCDRKIISKRPKKLKLNGHEYKVDYKLSKMNMAQYVDFQMTVASVKDHMDSLVDLLSIFVIPNGKKYGENYDINEVKEDLNSLRVDVALAITFFLRMRSENLIRNKLFYTRMMMKMMKWTIKDKEVKKQMEETMETLKEMEKTYKKK